MDDDELERFLREQKAKIARDQAQLERDLPYMEMQDHESESMKENIPQRGSNDKLKYNDDSSTLGLPLGAEYEKKKQKLKEQLRQDYRRYMAEALSVASVDIPPGTQMLIPLRYRKPLPDRLGAARNERYARRSEGECPWKVGDLAWLHCPQVRPGTSPKLHKPWHGPVRLIAVPNPQTARVQIGSRRWVVHTSRLKPYVAPLHDASSPNIALPGSVAADSPLPASIDLARAPVVPVPDRPAVTLRGTRGPARRTPARSAGPSSPAALPTQLRARSQDEPKTNSLETQDGVHEGRCSVDKRRKERYRLDLLEQMAEREQNKRREKQWNLAVPVSGVVDPQKDPLRMLKMLGSGTTERPRFPMPPQDIPPPDRPRRAFHTPPPPDNENDAAAHRHTNGLQGARTAALPGPGGRFYPASFATPYDPAYYYYAVHNPLEPGLPPFLGPPPQVAQLPRGFPGLTIGLGGLGETNNTEGRRGSFNKYQEDLQRQIKDTEEKKRRERMERDRQDARLEAEANTYNPWGKGGGGAPLRDDHGNLVTDLKQMRRQNEAAVHNPLKSARRVAPDSRGTPSSFDPQLYNHGDHRPGTPDDAGTHSHSSAVHGDGSGQTPRGGTLLDPSLPPQAAEQERYKDFLKQQIEEKRKREAEEREKIREEEEREERRLTEQRERIQREYEEEAEKKRKKEEEQRIKNEELAREAEERKKEVERKRREDEEKRTDEYRRQFERERQARREEVETRGASPPIPALVKKQGFPGTREEQGNGIQDGVSTGRGSPPVPARRNQLRTEGMGTDVLGELSLFRKQLQNEQRRLESQLRQQESSEEHRDARSGAGAASRDVFELARMRVQAPVRRPSSKGVPQHGPHAGHHPPPPTLNYPDDELLDIQRSALVRDQRRRHDAMRRPDPGERVAPALLGLGKDEGVRASRSSMLQSDSAFIGAFGEVFPTDAKGYQAPTAGQDGAWDWEPESRDIGISPRERRRQRHRVPLEQRQVDMYEPRRPPASPSLLSESSINVERLRARNAERMRRLQQMVTPGDDVSLGDPDDILSRFVSPSRPYSAVTTATDVWLRPGSCDSPGAFTERSNGE
ncbi:unnamed protein product [Lampetra planeri]